MSDFSDDMEAYSGFLDEDDYDFDLIEDRILRLEILLFELLPEILSGTGQRYSHITKLINSLKSDVNFTYKKQATKIKKKWK